MTDQISAGGLRVQVSSEGFETVPDLIPAASALWAPPWPNDMGAGRTVRGRDDTYVPARESEFERIRTDRRRRLAAVCFASRVISDHVYDRLRLLQYLQVAMSAAEATLPADVIRDTWQEAYELAYDCSMSMARRGGRDNTENHRAHVAVAATMPLAPSTTLVRVLRLIVEAGVAAAGIVKRTQAKVDDLTAALAALGTPREATAGRDIVMYSFPDPAGPGGVAFVATGEEWGERLNQSRLLQLFLPMPEFNPRWATPETKSLAEQLYQGETVGPYLADALAEAGYAGPDYWIPLLQSGWHPPKGAVLIDNLRGVE